MTVKDVTNLTSSKQNVVTCLSNSAQALIVAKGFELLGEASLSFVVEDNKFDLTFIPQIHIHLVQ